MPAWNSSWCLLRDFGCIHTKRYIVTSYLFNLTEEYMDVCFYDMLLMLLLLLIRIRLQLCAYIGNPVEKRGKKDPWYDLW